MYKGRIGAEVSMHGVMLSLLVALGCGIDADGDGYPVDLDCDDDEPAVNPSAAEVCDGIDNNCDGLVDAGAVDAGVWFVDGDGDGHGAPSGVAVACDVPSGFVDVGDDCDDGDASIAPGGTEVCNERDDDCDGRVDVGVADGTTRYEDADGDGHGDPKAPVTVCGEPLGTAADPDDCDDIDATVHPGAAERCNGVDDDCDALTDEAPVDATTWFADVDGDGWGDAGAPTEACDAPSGHVAASGDCDDASAAVHPGADERCDGADDDCDGSIDEGAVDPASWHRDEDGDGYGASSVAALACEPPSGMTADASDCDDFNAANHPGADERCDGVDNNCDTSVDGADAIDPATWLADADGDGWGDPSASVLACSAPAGHVGTGGDCDDAEPAAHPGADERCNGDDDDCDGASDEGAVDALAWHADFDGDGFGAVAIGALACAAPAGMLADASDCDDFNAANHPGADERCDGVDNNCDAAVDGADAVDPLTWFADADGDGFGASTSVTGCAAPGAGWVLVPGDCDDSDSDASPVAPEDCGNGRDDDCNGVVDDCAAAGDPWVTVSATEAVEWTGASSVLIGEFVSFVGDVDGDGLGDVVVGDDDIVGDGSGNDDGGGWILYGDPAPTGGPIVDEPTIRPTVRDWLLGATVAPAGDLDRDGYDEFWITAFNQEAAFGYDGAAYLVWGRPSRVVEASVQSISSRLDGNGYYYQLGTSAGAAGDFDGDGYDDAMVGEGRYNYNQNNGAVYLLFGGPSRIGNVLAQSLPSYIGLVGEGVGGRDRSLASGDLDGDGLTDLVLGGGIGDVVYLAYGDPVRPVGRTVLDGAAPAIRGPWPEADSVGFGSIAAVADVDDDGYPDPIVGSDAIRDAAENAGALFVLAGGAVRLPIGDTSVTTAWLTLYGGTESDHLGLGLGTGDFDADGRDDLAVGAWGWDAPFADAGMVGVLWGPPAAGTLLITEVDVRIQGEFGGDHLGEGVTAGDVDGDGVDDIVAGAPEAGPSYEGAVYLFSGVDL